MSLMPAVTTASADISTGMRTTAAVETTKDPNEDEGAFPESTAEKNYKSLVYNPKGLSLSTQPFFVQKI